jgi:hypothetical protein
MPSASFFHANLKADKVFSGAFADAPRWAISFGISCPGDTSVDAAKERQMKERRIMGTLRWVRADAIMLVS